MLPTWIASPARSMQFFLRQNFFGTLSWRKELKFAREFLDDIPEQPEEIKFYTLILNSLAKITPEIKTASELIDIGCRNWSYLPALCDFFQSTKKITGIELDGGRRYWNGYRRADYASAWANTMTDSNRKIQFIWKDFAHWTPDSPLTNPLFLDFFPFVSENPCLSWGLPLRYSFFETQIKTILNQSQKSKTGARICSTHQGEWERDLALEVYSKFKLKLKQTLITPSEFPDNWPGYYPIYVLSTKTTGD